MVCLTILLIGTSVFIEAGSMDYHAFLYAMSLIIPASVVIGGLGFLIGKVFESSKSSPNANRASSSKRNADLLIDDLLIDDVKNDELKDNDEP